MSSGSSTPAILIWLLISLFIGAAAFFFFFQSNGSNGNGNGPPPSGLQVLKLDEVGLMYGLTYPKSFVEGGKVYSVVWVDPNMNKVLKNDLATGVKEMEYIFTEISDSHAASSVVVDDQGYVYVVHGGHGSARYVSRSLYPRDISQWQTQLLDNAATYSNVFKLSGDRLLIWYRRGVSDRQWGYKTLNCLTMSLSSFQPLINFNLADGMVYPTTLYVSGRFYIVWEYRLSSTNMYGLNLVYSDVNQFTSLRNPQGELQTVPISSPSGCTIHSSSVGGATWRLRMHESTLYIWQTVDNDPNLWTFRIGSGVSYVKELSHSHGCGTTLVWKGTVIHVVTEQQIYVYDRYFNVLEVKDVVSWFNNQGDANGVLVVGGAANVLSFTGQGKVPYVLVYR